MSREWKPGDLGASVAHGYRGMYVASCRIGEHGRHGGPCWHNESGFADDPGDIRRPLVVIDPEDREAASRLIDIYFCGGTDSRNLDAMQRALREFADPTPPKLDEPQGLGAVVELVGGEVLVRTEGNVDTANWADKYGDFHWWSDIDVDRVLHDGWVQP